MATRNPVRVFPDPVGEAIRVSPPWRMSGQPSAWGGVGPPGKRRANQEATAGWNPSRVLTLLRVPGRCHGNPRAYGLVAYATKEGGPGGSKGRPSDGDDKWLN